LRCADGRTLSFYLSGWRRELDEAHYLILVGIDISERKRVEQERHQLEQMLLQAQKMESIGQLAGGIAHDFNNLLTGIRGYAELALLDAPNGERPQEDLQEILRATMSAAQLTQQLLAFSRKEIAAPRIIDVHAELESLSRMLTRLIGDTVDFRTEPMAERVTVLMDPLQLEQLLINLAINARDAMPMGGRLTTRTSNIELGEPRRIGPVDLPAGHYLLVEVQDTGTGISAESLEHIFEPFFTTKGEEEGTGLGLSTVYGIVIQNGGSLDVTSTVGVGSIFRIYLPWADGPVAELVALRSPSGESTPVADLEQTILLVEDDDRVRGITERILLELGYRVITCAGSAQALREAELLDGELDALLTDVMMPEMNGKELAEAITALYPHVCVIFASGYTKSVLGEDWVVERGFHFIQKPYSIKGLARLIKELL